MTTMTALDLTKQVPRSPYDQLAGYSWLPRMIDKVRALNAGTLGEYSAFPCGGDRGFMGAVGLDADGFRAQVDAGKTDAEIGEWVKAQLGDEGQAKAAGHRQYMITSVTEGEYAGYLAEYVKEIQAAQPNLDLSGATNFSKAICLEEGHPIPSA